MTKQHRHLVFVREEPQNPRRRGSAPRGPKPPADVVAHAAKLTDELDAVIRDGQPREPGFDPRRLFKVEAVGVMADAFEAIPGLSLVSEQDGHFLVLFATDEAIADFRSRLGQLRSGLVPTRKELLYALRAVDKVTPDDRKGAALRAFGLPETDVVTVDVELWPVPAFRQMLATFKSWAQSAGIVVVDSVEKPSLVLVRVRGVRQSVERLLEHRDVRLVDLPPMFRLERGELELNASNTKAPEKPADDAPVIGVLDSGIAENHPLLASAVADAQTYLAGREAQDEAGHGTAVASVALYGDIHERVKRGDFVAKLWIASGRILDVNNEYDDKLIHNQIARAVTDFTKQYGCRVFNLSIGDEYKPYTGGHVRGLAAELDRLAREFDVLFVVSAGNYRGISPFDEQCPEWLNDYPTYLLNNLGARICDPAPAMNAITVGSLARFEVSHQADRYPNDPAYQCVARYLEPSPFSRAGPGAHDCVKPELVEFGGNWAVDVRGDPQSYSAKQLGEPVANLDYIAQGRWLSECAGTSFAAPKIAHAAGLLLSEYSELSANLLRALLVAHARAPKLGVCSVRPELKMLSDARRLWGYGQVNLDRLLYSTERCVTLLAESRIGKEQHHFYELPLPEDFLAPGRRLRRISIGLSHMPTTRTTRLEYRASKMKFRLIKAKDLEQVSRVFIQTGKDEREKNIDEFRSGSPSAKVRDRGSVQAARYEVKDLPESTDAPRLFVVVTNSVLPWGEPLVAEEEPYALVVVVEEQEREEVRYFTQIQTRLQLRARERGRARA